MATYTPNRGYAQPQNGGDTGVWGTLLNSTMTILDNNMGGGGAVNVNVAGSSDVTPAVPQTQYLIQNLVGALTGSIAYKLPATGGFYVINNATSGAFTVTVKTTAPGSVGVVAPQGYPIMVWSNGTDVKSVTGNYLALLGALSQTVAGAVTFSGGVTFQVGSQVVVAGPGGELVVNGTIELGGAILSLGTTAPEGVVTGTKGDLYICKPGLSNASLWFKQSGAATNTGWKQVTLS